MTRDDIAPEHAGMMRKRLLVTLCLIPVSFAWPVAAKQKPRVVTSSKPTCDRASFPGDPVCGVDEGAHALPTPSSRPVRQPKDSSGFIVTDGISVDGKTNFNEKRYGDAPLDKLTPRPPAKASTNGGAQVDFQF